MAEVQGIDHYAGFVLGSAIHGGKRLPDGARFIDTHHAELGGHPVWLFSVSALGGQDSMFPPAVARRLQAMRKETPRSPRSFPRGDVPGAMKAPEKARVARH